MVRKLTIIVVGQRYPITKLQLPTKIRSLNLERRTNNELAPEEVQASIRAGYPAIHLFARC